MLFRSGEDLVVSAETISFRKSLKLGHRYHVDTCLIGVDGRTVFFEHRIVVDGEIFARAYVGTRLTAKTGTITREDMIEVFGAPPEDLELPDWLIEWSRNNSLPSRRQPAPHDWA